MFNKKSLLLTGIKNNISTIMAIIEKYSVKMSKIKAITSLILWKNTRIVYFLDTSTIPRKKEEYCITSMENVLKEFSKMTKKTMDFK